MKKRILCLVLGLVLTAGMSMTALAEEHQGAAGWQAEFNGKDIVSNFDNTLIADSVTQVLPGDSIELNVTIKNSDSRETDWYMTNEILSTLEDAQASASEGAYEYRLTYTNSDGVATDLYSSDSIGGTNMGSAGPEGLMQIDGAAGDYFYLERLKQGETGRVTLWLRVDGETQGNGYQKTLAQLQMNFAVELADSDTPPGGRTPGSGAPRTGDTSDVLIWTLLTLALGLFLLCFAVYRILSGRHCEEEAPAGAGAVRRTRDRRGSRRKEDGSR